MTLRNGAVGLISGPLTFGNLLVGSNAWLLMTNSNYTVTLSNVTVQAGGGIIADAFGYAAGQGPGAGQSYYNINYTYVCSGAGHGGYGANSTGNFAPGGNTYDSPTSPTSFGSGGGNYSTSIGGAGGGVIRLSLKGSLQVGGVISANGGNGSGFGGGGGSGGSIWLTMGTLFGHAAITANGGSGATPNGGGGGGGRIYISCSNNSFTGTISAFGGGGANWGGAGTVFIQTATPNYQLVLDNGGHPEASTPLSSVSSTDLTLRNGAIGLITSSLTFGNLLVSSNAWLLISNYSYTVTLSNATILAGGASWQTPQATRRARDLAWDNTITSIPPTCAAGRVTEVWRKQHRELRLGWEHS